MAASSRPEIFVSSMMPPGPRSRDSIREKRIVSHMTTCASITATMTAIHEPTFVPACPTATMTATIEPGPAKSGVPSGTSATFTPSSPVSGVDESVPMRSSMATRKSRTPPES